MNPDHHNSFVSEIRELLGASAGNPSPKLGLMIDLTFYYTGHGAQHTGDLCFDSGGHLSAKTFFEELKAAKVTGFVEIVLDSCFSGQWAKYLGIGFVGFEDGELWRLC